ncbi:MAG: hypothetical protein KAW93_00945 [Methanogenium sp.]|nr:hypothetical protein [Methanogenium sp.]
MKMTRNMKLTQEELDNIVNDPRCTLAHKMVISGRIERGDWIITDSPDQKSGDKIVSD